MGSTFLGIEIGKRGIASHQTGLNTISHNLSNAANENYSRQEVKISTMPPLYNPALNRESGAGQIGQGSTVASVTRVRDEFIDTRITEQASSLGAYDVRFRFLKQIEQVFNEPGQPTLKEKFDEFVQSWNDLASNSEESSARQALVTSSQNMLGHVRDHYENLARLRGHVDSMVRDKVGELNSLAKQVRDLNVEIVKVKAMGDSPNDLLDKRDALIEQMAKLADIKVVKTDPDETMVYVAGRPMVQGIQFSPIQVLNDPANDGMASLAWESGEPARLKSGEIQALIQVRDEDILGAMKKLNHFVLNLAESVNEIHKSGFGLNPQTGLNFFAVRSATGETTGNYDADKDGQFDSTRIFKVSGTKKLTGNEAIGEDGVMNLGPDATGKEVMIRYKATDRVKDVMERINQSPARMTAYLNHEGRFTLKALYDEKGTDSIVSLKKLQDSGVFLTSFTGILKQSGAEGAFDYQKINQTAKLSSENYTVSYDRNAASWMSVDSAILSNPMNIAARGGKDIDGDGLKDMPAGQGDGTNAFRIISALVSENEKNGLDPQAGLDHMSVMVDKNAKSFRPFLDSLVTGIAEQTKSDKMNLDKEQALMTSLKNIRESISGVNIDEELVNLIKYQHGYQASAKIINAMDQMLDVIMRLGR